MYRFGCMVNDAYRFNTVLRKSAIPCELNYVINPESATKGLNKLLGMADPDDVVVLAHQDMYFRNGWFNQMRLQMEKLPDDWGVVGIIGKDLEGRICGRIKDMRIVDPITSDHELPHEASCLDECVLIVRGSFRFDEGLDGFDLYGTLAVLQSWKEGKKGYVIDAPAEHYCMRPFSWFPDKDFERRYKYLLKAYPGMYIDSTVFYTKPNEEDL